MKLIWICMTNFGSVREEQRFHFPTAPGLYYLSGPNGSGKSTVWKAVTWCIYGKTPEGLKAGEVCTWGESGGTVVQLMFVDDDGMEWMMTRSWKPNRWELADGLYGTVVDLTKDETNAVLGMVRMSFPAFTQCIVMPQRRDLFLDLKPDAKAALFSEVLDLEQWTSRSGKASDAASALDKQVRELERDLAGLQGQLSQAQTTNYAIERTKWNEQQQDTLDSLAAEHSRLCEVSRKLRNEIQDKQKLHQAMELQLADTWVGRIRAADEALRQAQDKERQISKLLTEESVLLRLARERQHLTQCSKCGQAMDPKHKERCRAEAERSAELLEGLKVERSRAEDFVDQCRKDKTELDAEVDLANQQLRDMNYQVKRMQAELAGLEGTLDSVEDRAERLEQEENPWVLRAQEAEARVQMLDDQINAATDRLDALVARFQIASYWVRWFKDIRLQLVGEELTQLEVEANSCLGELGLSDWELRFDVDRETAKGTLQRGFTVTVLSPANADPVPWEAWSGGEAQRLLIATQMGMANLGRSNTGSTIDLEVWDEPTTHLEPQGVQDLLDCLERRAQTERRQIWIVDHTVQGFAGFAGTVRATKSERGTVYDFTQSLYR